MPAPAAIALPDLEGHFAVDAAASSVRFSVAHFRIQTVRGSLTGLSGDVRIAGGHLTADGTVDAASIRTGTGSRDAHLRSYLLRTDAHPHLRLYVDTPLAPRILATVTVRERPVPVEVTLEVRQAGRLHATFLLDRHAAGLTWPAPVEAGGVAVGREVRVDLDLALVPQG
ncbi:MAG: YceI family protein [Solirubrobacterales bacterium]|nr:YceI family protein [Solirubrobacterales bacterium]